MSYQVLARKWRPRSFSELVGQEHVVRALTNALDNDRLHHAYLFTGTRGVGKTTIARILAKSLNCEQGVSSTPCGECASCREIDGGRFVDLLEVDAASRTKVDQTRELLDNVPYAPVKGRFKVYLIDEVHMFSTSSFNALLKTLEEPPPHVKFLLATTDPQKLPVTVLSRCLQFNLKRLPMDQIEGQLRHILEQEGVGFERPALTLLARAADGSMRDALSLMDQAIGFSGEGITEEGVRAMLGTIDRGHVFGLLEALAAQDGRELLERAGHMAAYTPDYAAALQELLMVLHSIALVQAVPDALGAESGDLDAIQALADRLSPEEVQLFYQIALLGQRDLPLAPDPRTGFEMILLRMLAFVPDGQGSAPPPPRKKSPPKRPPPPRTSQAATPPPLGALPPVDRDAPQASAALAEGVGDWHALAASLQVGGIAQQLANNCQLVSAKDGVLVLTLDARYQQLRNANTEQRLLKALQQRLGADLQLRIEAGEVTDETPAQRQSRARIQRQEEALASMRGDDLVQNLESTFSARLVEESVKPIDPE